MSMSATLALRELSCRHPDPGRGLRGRRRDVRL